MKANFGADALLDQYPSGGIFNHFAMPFDVAPVLCHVF